MVQGEGEGSEMASGDFLASWCIAQTMTEKCKPYPNYKFRNDEIAVVIKQYCKEKKEQWAVTRT